MLRLLKNNINSMHTPFGLREIGDMPGVWKTDMESAGPWRMENAGEFQYDLSNYSENNIIISGKCSSVLDLSHYLLKKGELESWDSLLAIEQSEGRGRKGSKWHSPPGNIYGVLVFPSIPLRWSGLLSVFTGYSICDTLNRMSFSTKMKWPNDILLENRKVGGVLIEQKSGWTVAGVGINLTSAPSVSERGDSLAFPAGAICNAPGNSLTPLNVWDSLVRRIKKLYTYFLINNGIEEFLEAAASSLAFSNREVTVKQGEETFSAIFAGINSEGGARLIVDGKEKVIYDGQFVSARLSKEK